MTQKHCYILVEGQQDVLFIGRIFQTLGVPDVQNVDDISSVWTPLVDTHRLTEHRGLIAAHRQGLDIHQLFKGVCFQSATHSIVVRKVGGRGKEFRRNLVSIDLLLDGGLAALTAVGLVPIRSIGRCPCSPLKILPRSTALGDESKQLLVAFQVFLGRARLCRFRF